MQNEKQAIEEIDNLTTVLYEANHKKSVLDYRWLATEAHNAGYRKQIEGEWGFDGMSWTCSECGEYAPIDKHKKTVKSKFCPNCGAHMKGGAE